MKHIVFRILAGLVLLAAIGGIAFFAFHAGVAQGAALDVKTLVTEGQTQPPMPVYGAHGMMFHHAPFFGFGFGCFGILIPLFLLFLAFGAMRHLFWGHHMHHRHLHGPWGNRGPWSEGVPPMFVEWHRRAHADPPSDVPTEEKK